MSLASIMQLKKIEVPLTEANFRVLLQPPNGEGEVWLQIELRHSDSVHLLLDSEDNSS
jgi:hypothetical protein